ncbi:hypothetical protein E2L08_03170 [Palleronia sediminis]|uniref:Uncharacterized protein n=1 Tax=Palleronia sediminis TaxID=2547833 RepID=A0A4V3BAM6_9RHOB|nr:DUF6477 family protein [Palleronia sediminis]TDL83659.1 hypothetical protein E2L08_03170 [Palleronia sediminis]
MSFHPDDPMLYLAALSRPRLLVEAARRVAEARQSDAAASATLRALAVAEARHDRDRRSGAPCYDGARHVAALAALMAACQGRIAGRITPVE